MQGNTEVIAKLNGLLAGELTAIDQYFIHGRMCREWGLARLADHFGHEMQEEQMHAGRLIARILFLEGLPVMDQREPLHVGADIPEMLKNDLNLEYRVIANLRESIALCEKSLDFTTRDVLLDLLRDTEEDHTLWLETQLGLIGKIGLENYLQSQIQT
jgi:bacterioferritin